MAQNIAVPAVDQILVPVDQILVPAVEGHLKHRASSPPRCLNFHVLVHLLNDRSSPACQRAVVTVVFVFCLAPCRDTCTPVTPPLTMYILA